MCAHKNLKKQLVGDLHWYKCQDCGQKFKAEPWDGKMRVISPSPGYSAEAAR